MSIAKVENTATNLTNNPVEIEFTTLTALASGDKQYASGRYGAEIVPNKNDSRTAIVIKNAHASASVSVNIAPGNSPYSAESELAISVGAGKQIVVSLDSALYKDLSINGYVLYTTDTNHASISVACITLP